MERSVKEFPLVSSAEATVTVQRLSNRIRLMVIATAMIAAGLCVVVLLRRAHTDMSIPIAYHDDSLYEISVFKSIGEGNFPLQNARLAAPFGGSDWHDFPQYQWVDFVAYKVLSLFTHRYVWLLNWYWVLTVIATAGTAAYGLLRLRISPLFAGCLAFLFAMQPFVFLRNITHFMLTPYLIPLLAAACLEIGLGRWEQRESKGLGLRGIPLYAWVACLLQGFSFFYISFFAGLLMLVAAFFGACARRTIRPFLLSGSVLGVMFVAAIVGVSPTLLHWRQHGRNEIVTARSAMDAEINGLKIRHMLTPVPDNPVPFLQNLAAKAAKENPELTESVGTRLGLFASLGFVALILYILATLSGWDSTLDDGTVRACAALALAAVLWCTVGGFGSVFNTFVTPLVRGYDRIVVFILFFILASYGTVASTLSLRKQWALKNSRLVALAGLLITAGAFADALWFVPQTAAMREEVLAERRLTAFAERALGGKGMVFQIPYTPYSSGKGPGELGSFDGARPFIESAGLQWSWGTMNGTAQEAWEMGVSQLPAPEMIRELMNRGFKGVWIDTYGYDRPESAPTKGIEAVRQGPPVASSNGRYVFFDLNGITLPVRPEIQTSLPQPYATSEISKAGNCNVDSINWTAIPASPLSVSHLSNLYLNGWVTDVSKGESMPDVFVELEGPGGRRFYLPGSRTERPDVAEAFHNRALTHSGFLASGQLGTVPAGSYGMRVLQLGPDGAEGCAIGIKLDIR